MLVHLSGLDLLAKELHSLVGEREVQNFLGSLALLSTRTRESPYSTTGASLSFSVA